ncbi:hypothetical protein WDU94_012076, partial [Cyamophila willieti]
MTATSDCWLVGGASHDLPFHLWRRGYDVWLWNARGNMYSLDHVNMTWKNNNKFFLFSMHELGYYDTTASIDYILNVTGHKSVITIGHSMGTTNVLIAASTRPEYENKIKLNVLFAPSVFTYNVVVKGLADMGYSLLHWVNFQHQESFLEKGGQMLKLMDFFCDASSAYRDMCYTSLGLFSGYGSKQTVQESGMKLMSKFPAGSSLNVLKQQVQTFRTDEFKPLDYGRSENLKRYGTHTPSPYPIGKARIPTALYYACCNDFLCHAKDVLKLKKRLRNVVKFYPVPYKKFNHGDFLWAKDAYQLLYKDVLILIDQYTPS